MSNRLRNALVIGLLISVALNFVLVGIGIGQRLHDAPPMMRMNPMMGLAHFTQALSPERRAELDDALRAFRASSRPALGEMRSLQKQLRREIRRDPVDTAALKAALEALQLHMQKNQMTSADAFVRLIQVLSPEEREALDRYMHRGRHAMDRPHHPHHPPAPDEGLPVPAVPFAEPPPAN